MKHFNHPPQLVERILRWALPHELKEPILGDLAEEFQQRHYHNHIGARNWYIKQALITSNQFVWKTKRGLVMFGISIILFLVLSYMALWFSSDDLSMFLDVPSLLLIFPPSVMFAVGVTSVNDMKNAIKQLFNDELLLSKQDFVNAKLFFNVMGNSAILMAVFSTFIGAIAMGSHISADDFASVFGPAFAVCILVLMYSFGLKTLCYVAAQKLQYKMNHLE